jgi:hypothetical protein
MLTAATACAPLIEPVVKVFTPPAEGWPANEEWEELRFDSSSFARFSEPVDPSKISMRFIRQYEVQTDKFPTRLDVIYGVGVISPELTARISSE